MVLCGPLIPETGIQSWTTAKSMECRTMKRREFIVLAGSTFVLAACGRAAQAKATMEVHKQSTCGCCKVWAEYMEDHGYIVNIHNVSDVSALKRKYGVPKGLQSCHTTRVGGYTVEGHVPVELVDRLLAERPSIEGIALPDMPTGSPGMPGKKRGKWTVYEIKSGQRRIFTRI